MTENHEYFEYLEQLRQSGETNMLGAAPYLRREFPELSETEARDVLIRWMKTYERPER